MAKEGVSTISEALEIDDFYRLVQCLFRDEIYLWGLFCCISTTMALRVSDVLGLQWGQILYRGNTIVEEGKTKKKRNITIPPSTQKLFSELYSLLGKPPLTQPVFLNSQTGKAYTPQHINRLLKKYRAIYRLPVGNFSTHSFRKTFGRNYYITEGQTENALIKLCMMLNHGKPETTMTYLGFKAQEISNMYNTIEIPALEQSPWSNNKTARMSSGMKK